ncbi:protein FAR1-RELATED SEQUENCE 5-like [Spinacia oleracea]|uniref:Protein FAR1-RELATED SEQUENCE n=1 Tax=Spinacia oleracea TaxID=3562 RepID=A0ABM3QQC3_SPIOL|nr:protein FAR1-RELATED SEQUENCE 5-like [Spinacia oleracea]
MEGHKPVCIITDQDPAMKVAIKNIFDTSTHRFCIWHIMRKLSEKVGSTLSSNEDFMNQFKSCVYNSETKEEFESSWKSVINEFELQNNDWLSQMFSIRNLWIPAYFRDVFLGAVLRTTSRSEMEFWMRFESAVESQRHSQSMSDNDNFSLIPELKTNRDLERHASQVYTFTNFYKFQEQLWLACMDCEVEDKKETEEGLVITISNHARKNGKMREVVYNSLSHVARCSCKMFQCEGIPCRHILCILKGKGLSEVPGYYILNRWTKMAASKSIFNVSSNLLEGCSKRDNEDKLISNNWLEFMNCMNLAGRDPEKLTLISNELQNVSKQLKEFESNPTESKTQELESFIGSSAPKEVEILPPKQSNTKGSGKRMKGGKEKAMEQQEKKQRHSAAGGGGGDGVVAAFDVVLLLLVVVGEFCASSRCLTTCYSNKLKSIQGILISRSIIPIMIHEETTLAQAISIWPAY